MELLQSYIDGHHLRFFAEIAKIQERVSKTPIHEQHRRTGQSMRGDGWSNLMTLEHKPAPHTELVYVNGVMQRAGADYDVHDRSVVLRETPSKGDVIQIQYSCPIEVDEAAPQNEARVFLGGQEVGRVQNVRLTPEMRGHNESRMGRRGRR
ncbi:hypothetical protein SAMN02799624_05390 [Paenibacillus sp. UNC496MF]|uniref:hypothetical protein n=1 Tax=Paenibacillus sp. UNC496MF TaxID=1502753 RepID=UPI0008E28690|nr:hypothetical protein [Paenibacillus sp. UNC496MF]SFJ65279.1 hypothetical protein SAMN02799624_05390 [Paenibacillus sp. UNC496MF]